MSTTPGTSTDAVSLYLDLLKRSLTGVLSENNDDILGFSNRNQRGWKRRAATIVGDAFSAVGMQLVRKRP